jgi:hypothetical protein
MGKPSCVTKWRGVVATKPAREILLNSITYIHISKFLNLLLNLTDHRLTFDVTYNRIRLIISLNYLSMNYLNFVPSTHRTSSTS